MKLGNDGFKPKGGGFGAPGGFGVPGGGFGLNTTKEDPLAGVEYTGHVGDDAAAELAALKEGMRERARKERKRHAAAVDGEYWFAVYFGTRAEKDRFLKAAGVVAAMMGDKYIDGRKLATVLGIEYVQEDDDDYEDS